MLDEELGSSVRVHRKDLVTISKVLSAPLAPRQLKYTRRRHVPCDLSALPAGLGRSASGPGRQCHRHSATVSGQVISSSSQPPVQPAKAYEGGSVMISMSGPWASR